MCGIIGEFALSGTLELAASIRRLQMLAHRGPDGFGFECGDFFKRDYRLQHNSEDLVGSGFAEGANYFIGHRRLSIIDLSEQAFQPMEDHEKRYSITFNGEIYNYLELKEELVSAGCCFSTDHSDTEVLLNAYALWGRKCLDRLRGMFAFVIFDRMKKTLFFARDRIGKKPFYYELNNDKFSFSSELTPLLDNQSGKRVVDEAALRHYLVFGYILHPLSIFSGICKLPPANYGTLDLASGELTIDSYWDISSEEVPISFMQAADTVEACLDESVNLRLRSDVSVGAFVSGGIDSTLVLRAISNRSTQKYDVFGADFPNTDRSEKEYIEQAADRYGQRLNLSSIDLAHVDQIDDVLSVFDEPFDGGSSVAVFNLFKNARENRCKVILTGDGGDELFAGYDRYKKFMTQSKIKKILNNSLMSSSVASFLAGSVFKSGKLNQILVYLANDGMTNYLQRNNDFLLTGMLKSKNIFRLEDYSALKESLETIKERRFSIVKSLQYLELKTILPGRMLYKIDRFSMYNGVEARGPLLDHKLAELAFSLPSVHNIDASSAKKILKSILRKDFSENFIERRKQGFGNPFDNWFVNSNPERIFGILLNPESVIYNYLDYSKVHEFFPNLRNGYQGIWKKQLWRLIVLGHFLEKNKHIIS